MEEYTTGMTAAQEIVWCAARIKELYPIMEAEQKTAKETVRVVSNLLKRTRRTAGKSEICSYCGSPTIYAAGLCRSCYDRKRVNGTPEYKRAMKRLGTETSEPREKDPWYIRVYNEVFGPAESYPEDLEQGLLRALEFLTERERNVLLHRYRDGKTLCDTGLEFHLSRERIRQIEVASIRKLRKPDKGVYLELGLEMAERTLAENERIRKEREREWLDNNQKKYLIEDKKMFNEELFHLETGIEVLGLSVRAHNCLARGGVDSIGHLLRIVGREMDFSKLLILRNLGVGTAREIEKQLKEFLYQNADKGLQEVQHDN